jgi:hypothetical protein
VSLIYLTATVYIPTTTELGAGLTEDAVMCTSLKAEKVAFGLVQLAISAGGLRQGKVALVHRVVPCGPRGPAV